MFEFRTDCEPEMTPNNWDLVLYEAAIDGIRHLVRQEIDGWHPLDEITRTLTSPQSPQKVLLPRQGEVMKKVHIEGCPRLPKLRLEVIRAVDISLNTEI